jgi:hypothetical protein
MMVVGGCGTLVRQEMSVCDGRSTVEWTRNNGLSREARIVSDEGWLKAGVSGGME